MVSWVVVTWGSPTMNRQNDTHTTETLLSRSFVSGGNKKLTFYQLSESRPFGERDPDSRLQVRTDAQAHDEL